MEEEIRGGRAGGTEGSVVLHIREECCRSDVSGAVEGSKGCGGTLGELTSDGIVEVGDGPCWTQLGSGAGNVSPCQSH